MRGFSLRGPSEANLAETLQGSLSVLAYGYLEFLAGLPAYFTMPTTLNLGLDLGLPINFFTIVEGLLGFTVASLMASNSSKRFMRP